MTKTSKTLFGYFVRGLILNCSVAFFVLEAVQGIIFTVRATESLSFDILIIFPVLVTAFAMAVSYTLPLSLLFGTSLLVGRLNADREITALRSFGVSPAQVLLPAAVFGGLVSLGAYYFNSEWAPAMRFANRHAETLILDRLGYLGEGWNLPYSTPEWTLWINHYDGPVLEGIFVSTGKGSKMLLSDDVLKRVKAPSYPVYFFAERGLVTHGTGKHEGQLVIELKGVTLFFDNDVVPLLTKGYKQTGSTPPATAGEGQPEAAKGNNSDFMQRLLLEHWVWPIKFPEKAPSVKDMSAADLRGETAERLKNLRQAEVGGTSDEVSYAKGQYWYAVTEFHRRLALSLSAVMFCLCAFALGLSVTSSNRLLPFFLATLFVPSLYFSCEMLGNYISKDGFVPWLSEEMGNLAVGGLICALVWRLRRKPRR